MHLSQGGNGGPDSVLGGKIHHYKQMGLSPRFGPIPLAIRPDGDVCIGNIAFDLHLRLETRFIRLDE